VTLEGDSPVYPDERWAGLLCVWCGDPDAAEADLTEIATRRERDLIDVCGSGEIRRVHRLLYVGTNPNAAEKDGLSALCLACYAGDLDAVRALLEGGAYADGLAPGFRPLVTAAIRGHFPIGCLLVEHGARVDGDPGYHTPLAAAASRADLEFVDYLLYAGADPNAVGEHGQRPLHAAITAGYRADHVRGCAVTRALIRYGADIDAKDQDGDAPLALAAAVGCLTTVQYLYAIGADMSAKNADGETALDVAVRCGRRAVVEFLHGLA
jgi:ankyrin repeat protein